MFGFERPFGEVVLFSANVWSYITASENVQTVGDRCFASIPHGEGETFLGFIPWLLAAVGASGLIWHRSEKRRLGALRASRGVAYVTAIVDPACVITQFIAVMSVVLFGGFDFEVFGLAISARTPQRLLMQFASSLALLLGISPRARIEARANPALADLLRARRDDRWRCGCRSGRMPNAGDSLRVWLRPLRRALRLRAWLQRRPRHPRATR